MKERPVWSSGSTSSTNLAVCVTIDNNDCDKPRGIQSYGVDDVKEVIRAAVCTPSMTGAIGYAFAGKHPDMVSSAICLILSLVASMRHEQENYSSWKGLCPFCSTNVPTCRRCSCTQMFDGLALGDG